MRTGCVLVLLTATAFASKDVTKTVPLGVDGRVTIHTEKGSVHVSTWERPDVEIQARIEPDSSIFQKSSENAVEDTEIQIDSSASSVRVKTDYTKARRHGWSLFGMRTDTESLPLVHYRIRMPPSAAATIKDYKSRIEVSGVRSDLEIETYKGEVLADGVEGSIRLKSYKGEAGIRILRLTGRSSFETYKGSMRIDLPRGTGFTLDTELGRRAGLHSDFELVMRTASRQEKNFHGAVNGGGPEVRLKSHKGEFRLRKR